MRGAHKRTVDLTQGYQITVEYGEYGRLQDATLDHDQQAVCKLVDGRRFQRYPQGKDYPTFVANDYMRASCMGDDLTFCFSYVSKVIQGCADCDGFGMEPDEWDEEYVILDGQGNLMSHRSYRKPEGYDLVHYL